MMQYGGPMQLLGIMNNYDLLPDLGHGHQVEPLPPGVPAPPEQLLRLLPPGHRVPGHGGKGVQALPAHALQTGLQHNTMQQCISVAIQQCIGSAPIKKSLDVSFHLARPQKGNL